MPLVLVLLLFVRIISPLHATSARDTISPSETLGGGDELVSGNGKYKLGFFQTGSESSRNTSSYWYLGIRINRVPTMTPVWVANGDDPIADLTAAVLTISPDDGNLVVLNPVTGSIIWSTQANTTTNDTIATLSDGGNLVLQKSLDPSDVLWQSFDHPTSCLLPGAKLGRDKLTGLNRRLVSRKNSINQAHGAYSLELDPTGPSQFVLVEINSGITYWSSGEWNGQFFNSIPDMGTYSEFVNNSREVYLTTPLKDSNAVAYLSLEVSGQARSFIWYEQLQDWVTSAVQPKSQCDVYALCGPYTVCDDNVIPSCSCMKGFSIKSPKDWELEDRTGGCIRNTPLDCSSNKAMGSMSTDGFYSIPCFRLPQNAQNTTVVASEGECAQVCLSNCSCTAYSFGDYGCYVWHDELLNVKQQQHSDLTNTKVELNVRLAGKELKFGGNHRRPMLVWVVTSAAVALFGLVLLLMIWRNRTKRYCRILNSVQGGNGIVAFRFIDLQHATKSFSVKLGSGGFGSVYKGFLADSTAIAVKMLDGIGQGEKQFRAEVSSIGIIQHINLVKLIGFCSEGNKRLLVYEYLPYHSLDVHLFQSSITFLNWKTRYQVALGVARGLAYLHESCRECIIHCDIKPQNILLDASFTPKIADFGMAKVMKRDFNRALTTMRGTIGYLAPEWLSGVAITSKIDVYSYGMVLLEIISGRRNTSEQCTSCAGDDVYFPLRVANNLLKGDVLGLVDPKLCEDVSLEEVERVCKIACWCIQDKDSDRPAMGEVVQILEGRREVDVPPVPKILQAVAGSHY
ncbi:G-type lectin S-receptor-like serine/threonine-protein kinase [Dichanthelium oligosanthes]|uniref:Receptor-like serine/threonine-protein kinase n=1 Tax=Dichanthelium oligosanthes TaxID=888268 RepID=A0A1E5VM04_9POAL|nr:G-type lectin S-receptor-like serine/threonine-protein kinase [Dichanthelium oligosanthes]